MLDLLINIANVLYTISYSVRDILWLRILTVAGIAFTIPYYYLQPTPLLVPIGWDVAFAALNLYWIAKLLLERRPVQLAEDEQRLYRLCFRTFTPREMAELTKIGSWQNGAAGDVLIEQGSSPDWFGALLDGAATAEMDRVPVGELRSGHFVGPGVLAGQPTEPATVRAKTAVRFMRWRKKELAAFLKARPEMSASLALIVAADLVTLLAAAEQAEARAGRATSDVTNRADDAR